MTEDHSMVAALGLIVAEESGDHLTVEEAITLTGVDVIIILEVPVAVGTIGITMTIVVLIDAVHPVSTLCLISYI